MPECYTLIRAARYLGVPPWELAKQPRYWRDHALMMENCENWAEREALKRTQKRR